MILPVAACVSLCPSRVLRMDIADCLVRSTEEVQLAGSYSSPMTYNYHDIYTPTYTDDKIKIQVYM